jgi:hypothetical protein
MNLRIQICHGTPKYQQTDVPRARQTTRVINADYVVTLELSVRVWVNVITRATVMKSVYGILMVSDGCIS